MAIFSYFLCCNIQELTAYFQGSLYMFRRHNALLNLGILVFTLKFSSVSYINTIVSSLVLVFDQLGQSVIGYSFPTNA